MPGATERCLGLEVTHEPPREVSVSVRFTAGGRGYGDSLTREHCTLWEMLDGTNDFSVVT